MYAEDFVKRLTCLRMNKKVSARDMSLSLGQSENYIYNIEAGRALPSMLAFFNMCDYLGTTPSEFFDIKNAQPERLREAIKNLQKLDNECFNNITAIIANLAN